LSGTNWLGSSIFIDVPMLLPGSDDFIHWGKKRIKTNWGKNSNKIKIVFFKLTTRGQANTDIVSSFPGPNHKV